MNKPLKYDIIVIGAGLAGISAAIRAKHKGNSVLVIEKNKRPGGKIETITGHGFRFDTGPSLFTEPKLVDELFELFGKNPRDYFNYKKYSKNCSYYFPNGDEIHLSQDASSGLSELDQLQLNTYLDNSLEDYKTLGKVFLERPSIKPIEFMHPRYYKYYGFFLSKKMRNTLADYNTSFFSNKQLTQIFNRFGTYNGSSPYKMKGLYSMIPSLELKIGTYFPEKGMRSIIDSLYTLAKEVGIDFIFNVQEIESTKTLNGYHISTDVEFHCSKLVCAIDHITFYKKILVDSVLYEKYKKAPRSSSGLVFYWGIDRKIPEIGLHNILFNDNYQEEFEAIFETKKTMDKPTIYLHNSSSLCPQDSPEKGQTIFAMINIPSEEKITSERRKYFRQYIIDRIKSTFKVDISKHIQFEDYQDNRQIEQNTGSYLGALYGANSNSIKSIIKRHPNTVSQHQNLFFCGGTVHPGGGIPLILRSSKIISELL